MNSPPRITGTHAGSEKQWREQAGVHGDSEDEVRWNGVALRTFVLQGLLATARRQGMDAKGGEGDLLNYAKETFSRPRCLVTPFLIHRHA